ncbi:MULTISPECIES: CrcB family protein [unclassified Staphylococcus]|uniref:fluoride efflux transporter FluC n=1 Tax=unclassified Staphylococcus TaxID=91994 RepID=UPI0021CFC70D|nr:MULTISPECIES: CrcB family protein [unclassified Staphylococcus]UXR79372.1 CrcB family protein [Staphylococcus sp. IVB6227]UXR83524.1 CrcB family protein [Staphylococcus sp. IVB6214]
MMVLLGGGIGAILRAIITDIIAYVHRSSFPIATAVINLIGSCFIGMLGGILLSSTPAYTFFITGILGGFTTFSTVQLELVQLMEKRQSLTFIGYSLLQYIGCFISCYIGTHIV